jgi:hypothetical protein
MATTKMAAARAGVFPESLLCNGGFEIWQRGAGPFTTGSSDIFSADEWQIEASGGGSQITVTENTSDQLYGDSCMEVAGTIQVDGSNNVIDQGVEAYKSLEGQWVTFSLWVKTTCRKFSVAIIDYVSSGEGSGGGYHCGTGEWQQITETKLIRTGLTSGPGDWPHGFGIRVGIWFWEAHSGSLIDGAMLVPGYYPEGVPYAPLQHSREIKRCHRYYEASPGSILAGLNYDYDIDEMGDSQFYHEVRFHETKAATPVITRGGDNPINGEGSYSNGGIHTDGFYVRHLRAASGNKSHVYNRIICYWNAEVA